MMKLLGKNFLYVKKASFLPYLKHIKPYYTKIELLNLGLNLKIIKNEELHKIDISSDQICNKIRNNDISSEIIMKHKKYILDNDKIGIIQYYTFQGSYFINEYLRNNVSYFGRNHFLEKIIKSMWKLIVKSPKFDKSYILYRFIQTDDHLNNLEVKDIYVNDSFLSTTRDPFYNSSSYQFGFILIKIKIPENKIGVGLCLESLSNFKEEQEIILPPKCKLRLDKKDNNIEYYHTDINFFFND